MTALWTLIASGLWKPLLAGLVLLGGAVGLYAKGGSRAATNSRIEKAGDELKARRTRDQVDRELRADPTAADRVLGEYARERPVVRGVGTGKPDA